jgi:pimeloyl-ACP methyl ester carboxylesterase
MGDEDKHAHAEYALAAAPKMDVRVMENTGHFPLWQQRERFIKELANVLQTYAR